MLSDRWLLDKIIEFGCFVFCIDEEHIITDQYMQASVQSNHLQRRQVVIRKPDEFKRPN